MHNEIQGAVAMADRSTATGQEVKPYRIHVSSRYLNLTKQKLEIARLPHEFEEPRSVDWWQPKSQVEPLIDFWLEQYQWRDQEQKMNGLPQFRTGFTVPQSDTPIRTQFIHVKSSHANAVPLLLIPPFPFPSLVMGHLVKLFTTPEGAEGPQPFHLVIPSLPGLGFSDPLPTNTPVISTTAGMLDTLMKRLGYRFYLVTNAGAGTSSPAQIDFKIAEWLSTQYSDSCLGSHFISPPLPRPKLQEAPVEWAKWSVAKHFGAAISGYRAEDLSAFKRGGSAPAQSSGIPWELPQPGQTGLGQLGLNEPNTLAYALCDSPTGLLVFMLKALRLLAPEREFTPTEIINFTQVAWLPGPEAALRSWGYCLQHPEKPSKKATGGRPRVALTVFLGNEQQQNNDNTTGRPPYGEKRTPYSCPGWARTRYNVVHTHRAPGRPGLLAWERPEMIVSGARGLAAAVLKEDARLKPSPRQEESETAAAEAEEEISVEVTTPFEERRPVFVHPQTHTQQGLLAPPRKEEQQQQQQQQRLQPVRESSDDTKVASSRESLPVKTPSPLPSPSSPAITVGGA
ncbi:alpha/beta-hydrolase [Poronia punctata]|nr:alpha/beta-hydrolase [Poronia punctata]